MKVEGWSRRDCTIRIMLFVDILLRWKDASFISLEFPKTEKEWAERGVSWRIPRPGEWPAAVALRLFPAHPIGGIQAAG